MCCIDPLSAPSILDTRGAILASRNCEQSDINQWRQAQASESEEAPAFFEAPLVDPIADEPIGALLVGPRPDGTICNRDEREALLTVAPAIARAIATARARAEREERLLKRISVASRASLKPELAPASSAQPPHSSASTTP
jgi:hypothetical protein